MALRENFVYEGYLIETFSHDLETLNYFAWEMES